MKALDSKYKELILCVMGAHQLVLNCMLSADSQEGSYTNLEFHLLFAIRFSASWNQLRASTQSTL
jgi:hypothetical protein